MYLERVIINTTLHTMQVCIYEYKT